MDQSVVKDRQEVEHNKIKANQAVFIHELAPSSQVGGLLLSIIVVVAFWKALSFQTLLFWFVITNFISVLRLIHWYRARNKVNNEAYMLVWLPKLQFLLFLSGLSWGVGSWFLYLPNDLFLTTLLILFLIGIISGGIGALSPYLPCYIIYSLSAGIPFAIKLFIEHESISIIMPIALILYIVVNTLYARNIQNNILKIILLRFENSELVSKLTHKNTEAQLQTEIAEKANLSKSQFLAAASHDLAQPLHSLSLFLSALENNNNPEQQREYINKANQCAKSMNDLFNVLMDISKLDAGVVESKLENFNSNDLINPIAQEFEINTQNSPLKFEIDIDNYSIETDGIIFQRIIRNLLSNAIKHNSQGVVGIRTQFKNGHVSFEVFDNGKGIPENQLDNIFLEYIQLDNPERDQKKGLGLGLPIVKRLSKLINADISVKSEIDKGTVFSLSIKCKDKSSALLTASNSHNKTANLEKVNILFIDDDSLIRDGMQAMANIWGCQMLSAEDDEQAIELLIKQDITPDIIISDYRLRDNKTGIEAINRINDEFNSEFPALIITGDTSPEITKLIHSKAIKVIYKPIDKGLLKSSVYELLAS